MQSIHVEFAERTCVQRAASQSVGRSCTRVPANEAIPAQIFFIFIYGSLEGGGEGGGDDDDVGR